MVPYRVYSGLRHHGRPYRQQDVMGNVDTTLLVYEYTKQAAPRERLAMGREDIVRHPLAGPLLRSANSIRKSSKRNSFPGSLN